MKHEWCSSSEVVVVNLCLAEGVSALRWKRGGPVLTLPDPFRQCRPGTAATAALNSVANPTYRKRQEADFGVGFFSALDDEIFRKFSNSSSSLGLVGSQESQGDKVSVMEL